MRGVLRVVASGLVEIVIQPSHLSRLVTVTPNRARTRLIRDQEIAHRPDT